MTGPAAVAKVVILLCTLRRDDSIRPDGSRTRVRAAVRQHDRKSRNTSFTRSAVSRGRAHAKF